MIGQGSHIERRIHAVNILLIQLLPQKLDRLAKALEVHDFPLPQEGDHIVDIGIIGKPQDIVVCHPGFLFWYDHLKPTKIKLIYDGTSHFQ